MPGKCQGSAKGGALRHFRSREKPMGEPIAGITRRGLIKAGAIAALDAALPKVASAQPRFIVNDASGLNPTPVYRHWIVGTDEQSVFIERLRRELKEAAAERRPVAVAAARHTMGGQSLPRDGTAITINAPLRARHARQDLPRRRRHALAPGDRHARSARLLARRHAVERRLRRRQHVLRQRARLAGALRAVRLDRARAPADAGRRHHPHLLAHREPGAVRPRHGRLRLLRHHPRARGRHGGEPRCSSRPSR